MLVTPSKAVDSQPAQFPSPHSVSGASQQKDFSGPLAVAMMRWTSSCVKKLAAGYKLG